ncbi:MAG: excisionase family DNA-binding protein [Planctomycetota bacterium]
MNSELMSFEEASRELGVTEEELEQLVAAGEIASIKQGDTVCFKKTVVQKFKKSREQSVPTILLSEDEIDLFDEGLEVEELEPEGAEEGTTPLKAPASGKAPPKRAAEKAPEAAPQAKAPPTEEPESPKRMEISLDDLEDIDVQVRRGPEETEELEVAAAAPEKKPGRPKKDASDEDTLLSLDGVLEDDLEGTTPVPSAVEAGETLLDTDDLLDVEGLGGAADPFAADTVEEEASLAEATEAGTLLRSGAARVMRMKRKESQAPWTVVLAVAALILMVPLGVLLNLLYVHAPSGARAGAAAVPAKDAYAWIMEYNFLDGAIEGIADLFASR